MTLALVVPSYGRPDTLARCLASAAAQTVPFDQVVVAVRAGDDPSGAVARAGGATVVTVHEPGVLAAMAAGVRAASAAVIGFTDDDAELAADWSARVGGFFADPANERVGGFGGRDVLFDDEVARPTRLAARVGVVSWWGRVTGRHHCGTGPPRPVAVLKGVNAAYRREALGLPVGLRGAGAEAHFEVAVGAFARRGAWTLVYDPTLRVRHHPAARTGEDQRAAPSDAAVADSAYNLMRALAPTRQTRRWLYVHLVGDAACPGLARCALAAARGDRATLRRRRPSWRGTSEAWRLRRAPLEFLTFTPTGR